MSCLVESICSTSVPLTVVKTKALASGRKVDRAVVFVNSVGMQSSMLEVLARRFLRRGWEFVSWELRGSPGASLGIADSALATHVQDGETVVNSVDTEELIFIGWCTGAFPAIKLAQRFSAKTACLILHDAAFLFNDEPGGSMGNAVFTMCRDIVQDMAVADFYYNAVKPKDNEAKAFQLDQHGWLVPHLLYPYSQGHEHFVKYAYAIWNACDYDLVNTLKSISIPTLLMAGKNDLMVSYQKSISAKSLLTDASLILSQTRDHYSLFTDEGVVADITDFIDSRSEVYV